MNSYAQVLKSHEVEVCTVFHVSFLRVISLINFHIIQKKSQKGWFERKLFD